MLIVSNILLQSASLRLIKIAKFSASLFWQAGTSAVPVWEGKRWVASTPSGVEL